MEKTKDHPLPEKIDLLTTELNPIEVNFKEHLSHYKTNNFWTVFSSTFITIFLAEIGDKTQLVTLFMSAESQSPWIVFLGAAMALVATSLLGVLIGYWLAKKLSPKTLDLGIAILLLLITGWLIQDIIS
nr:TMEM165/GDT1 family protein [Stanieria cyanosphaera]